MGCGAACGHHAVVGRVNAVRARGVGDGHTAHAHGFVEAHIFVGVASAAVDVKHIAAHAVVGGGHSRDRTAVVHTVHTGVIHIQNPWCDVGCGAACSGHAVVGGVGAADTNGVGQAHTAHTHHLRATHVFVGKTGGAVDVKHIIQQTVVGGGHRGHIATVVNAVHATVGQVQNTRRDGG